MEIAVGSWGCSAQTYGPPETCYPAEGMECWVKSAWLTDGTGSDVMPLLTNEELSRFEQEFIETPPEPDYREDY